MNFKYYVYCLVVNSQSLCQEKKNIKMTEQYDKMTFSFLLLLKTLK